MKLRIITTLVGLALYVGCTKSQPKPPMFHVISADPCNLQLIGTVENIKYVLKTEESYFIDTTGSKHLTFLTKAEYDEQFKKWEANKTPENLPKSSVCAGLRMDTVGQDFPVVVDNQRGEIVITVPAEKQTTTFMIEHEESTK
jgi:hypothetical protein